MDHEEMKTDLISYLGSYLNDRVGLANALRRLEGLVEL